MMTRPALILILAMTLGGCATTGSVDWTALVIDAAPEFKPGPCGPELQWTKTIAVHDAAEIEGILIVRPRCEQPTTKPTKE